MILRILFLVHVKILLIFMMTWPQIPASVRVRRQSALPKPKPKAATNAAISQQPMASAPKPESVATTSAPKAQSIDDSYTAFLEDMKALGALDS